MDVNKVKDFWLNEADDAMKVAGHLFEKDDYSYSLFFGHLAVEKLLKAIYVEKKNEHAPFIHNLEKLAKLCELPLSNEKNEELIKITAYNIESRYPDEKNSFRTACTKEFTETELNAIKELYQWLKSTI